MRQGRSEPIHASHFLRFCAYAKSPGIFAGRLGLGKAVVPLHRRRSSNSVVRVRTLWTPVQKGQVTDSTFKTGCSRHQQRQSQKLFATTPSAVKHPIEPRGADELRSLGKVLLQPAARATDVAAIGSRHISFADPSYKPASDAYEQPCPSSVRHSV